MGWKGFDKPPQCVRCDLLTPGLVFVRAAGPTCLDPARCEEVKAHRKAKLEEHKLAEVARSLFTAAAAAGMNGTGFCGVDLGHADGQGSLVTIGDGKVEIEPVR